MIQPFHNPAFSHDFGAQLWGMGELARTEVIDGYRPYVAGAIDDATAVRGWKHIDTAYERDYGPN